MSYEPTTTKDVIEFTAIGLGAVTLTIGLIWGCFAMGKSYSVWSAEMDGKAELAHANFSKQIAVQEAHAKMESASLLADAEVARAVGVAKANKIIGDSLKDNQSYLTYLWINNLDQGKNQVIYIPTEANIPILEASRFGNNQTK